jgi:osmotically-inducible protein OsmY
MRKNILQQMGASLLILGLTGCAGPVLLAGAAGGAGANTAGSSVPVSQQVSDITIKSQIFTIIQNTPKVGRANIEVTVFNGLVLLLGQVPTQTIKTHIAEQAAKLKGVIIVYNQLTVGPNVSFGRFADDSWLTSKIKTRMIGEVNPLHFKIVTQQGVVYLLGQVTETEGDAAAKVAAETSGVRSVVKIFNIIAPASTAVPTEVMPVTSLNATAPVAHTSAAPATQEVQVTEAPPIATTQSDGLASTQIGEPGPNASD